MTITKEKIKNIVKGSLPEELKKNNSQEADRIWDEYKYRHDLVWKHMIRSTLLLVTLIVLPYTDQFDENKSFIILAFVVVILYQVYNYYCVIRKEIELLYKIKLLHRKRQIVFLELRLEGFLEQYADKAEDEEPSDEKILEQVKKKAEGKFKQQIASYCLLTFIFSLIAIAMNIDHVYCLSLL